LSYPDKNIIRIFIFLLTVTYFQAQQPAFIKRIHVPGSKNGGSKDIIETLANHFVLAGYTEDSTSGFSNLTLLGIDSVGNIEWQKVLGDTNFKYLDIFGSAHLLAAKDDFLYFATTGEDSLHRMVPTLLKLDYNGNILSRRRYYIIGPNESSYIYSIKLTPENNLLLIGTVNTFTTGTQNNMVTASFIIKLNLAGDLIWKKRLYQNDVNKIPIANDAVQDSASGKIFVVGCYGNNYGFLSMSMILDSLGNRIYNNITNGTIGSGLTSVIQTRDKYFVAVGSQHSTYEIYTLETNFSTIVKFDIDGTVLFTKKFDTLAIFNEASRVVELRSGQLVTSGEVEGWYRSTGNSVHTFPRIACFDKDGNLGWVKYFSNYQMNYSNDVVYGMVRSKKGEIVFTSQCTCYTPEGTSYMFYRTDTLPCDLTAVKCYNYTDINESLNLKLNVFPNPSTSEITISSSQLARNYTVTISNLLGVELKSINLKPDTNKISIQDLSAGVYFLHFFLLDTQIETIKLVVEK
jgi:hypothetical protein